MPETIGQRLKRAREYRHLTLEKVAEVTRIRLQYLQALEADDFSAMPSPVQARGFLRNYADYLGLDLEQIVAELRSAAPPPASQEVVFEGDVSRPAPYEAGAILPPQGPMEEKASRPASRKTRRKKPLVEQEAQPASAPEPEPAPVPPAEPAPAARPGPMARMQAAFAAVQQAARGWAGKRFSRRKKPLETEPASPESEARAGVLSSAPAIVVPERSLSSQEIFESIGRQLRRRRDVLGLSLEEIERHIRLRAQFLLALEEGRMDDLPSPVQTRGMLSNYATFLDLDADALLLRFADALQAKHRERYPARPAKSPPGAQGQSEKLSARQTQAIVFRYWPRFHLFIAGDLVFGVGIFIILVVFVAWGVSRVTAIRTERAAAQATAPSISEVLIGTPEVVVIASATPIPVEDTPLPPLEETLEIPTAAQIANVQVNIVALERSYMRVLVDGKAAFEGRTTPGTVYPFQAEKSIEVLAGNASALRIIYNQRDLGLLGGFGQLAHYVYTIDQIVIPTPVASLTPTLTPFVTPTPSATPSPTPSPTIPPAGDSL